MRVLFWQSRWSVARPGVGDGVEWKEWSYQEVSVGALVPVNSVQMKS